MCGIAGIFSYTTNYNQVSVQELTLIRDQMKKRGPDAAGIWVSDKKNVGLAHRRLSIIDLSEAGIQPMFTANKRYVIVFNGEIYNYQTLKKGLEQKGILFQSHSDTEVLLQLYVQYGAKMLPLLRGMFAFAIWDTIEQTLFVARDHLGIKPLYYNFQNGVFRFASQVKALLAGEQIKTTSSAAGQVGFFIWGHIPEPFTLFNEIKSLPAGSYLKIRQGDTNQTPVLFWQLRDVWLKATQHPLHLSKGDRQNYLREVLKDSTNHHLIADVPVGVFLSSGLDSTTLTALTSENKQQVQTITLGFKEYQNTANDETILANKVANQYSTQQSTHWISQTDFQENLSDILQAMDQPSIDGVNTYFVCKAAAKAGLKVALSGVGGDELFAGYDTFRSIPKRMQNGQQINRIPFAKQIVQNIVFPIAQKRLPSKAQYALNYTNSLASTYFLSRCLVLPEQLNSVIEPAILKKGMEELNLLERLNADTKDLPNAHSQISVLEMNWYMRNQLLRDTDWASMAHSLEVRTPLVDIDVIQKIAPLYMGADCPTKKEMAMTPAIALPNEILNRPKTGFSIPVAQWLLKEYPDYQAQGYKGWAQFLFDTFTT
jgi:asparagine synthase (glutamine-hydrolysing)